LKGAAGFSAGVVLCITLCSGHVRATSESAHRYYVEGIELVEHGELQAGRLAFEQAYRESPHYVVLYNLGRVCLELADYAAALGYLQRYLEEGGEAISEQQRQEVGELLADAKAGLASKAAVTGTSAGPAPVSSAAPEPLPRAPASSSPPHPSVSYAARPGRSRVVHVPRSVQAALDRERHLGYATGFTASGLAILVSSGVLAVWNQARYDDWVNERAQLALQRLPAKVVTPGDLVRLAAYEREAGRNSAELKSIQRFDTVVWTTAGIGGALLAAGVIAYVTAPRVEVGTQGRSVKISVAF
jgi:hypothetical protein